MSFRTEEKLYVRPENLIQFQEFLTNKSVKKIHHPRIIESLYFDNLNLDMHNDSVEGLVPRKKIRIRNYPNDKDLKIKWPGKRNLMSKKDKSLMSFKEFLEKVGGL